MRRAIRWLAAAGCAVVCQACTTCLPVMLEVSVPARDNTGDPTNPGQFRAGAGREDITPIPGVALGGYSIDGKAARGFWTRLYARALYLKDPSGKPLVLISTDLGAIPGGLGDEVARLLNAQGMPWISREHVVLAATHTHHGPGNFYTSKLFNSMISPWVGFDKALFDFLAQRIANAAKNAWKLAVDAELLVTDASALEVSKEWNLDTFFRNRSLPAFLLNPRAPKLLDSSLNPTCPLWLDDPDTADQPDTRACQAVRPRVELLGIRAKGTLQYLGVAAFVPVHATVLSPSLEVYSSDLFGVADALLENASACAKLTANPVPVVAFFNGAEGDVSPATAMRDREDVVGLGTRLSAKVCQLLDRMRVVDTNLRFRFARVALKNKSFDSNEEFLDANGTLVRTQKRSTTTEGVAGAASVGGAEDGRSTLYKFLGHREGKTSIARSENGPKSKAGHVEAQGIDVDFVQFMRWTSPAPDLAPIGIYEIGSVAPNVVIVTLPGEFTTQMGERVRQAVWGAIPTALPRPAKPEHVLLIGLANEYVGYFTTPEEYDAQHYEGAMTLYGAASGPFLASALARLAQDAGDVPTQPKDWQHVYVPGDERLGSQAENVAGAPYFADDGIAALITRSTPAGVEVRRDLPVFCWRDALPRLAQGVATCERTNPVVRIESKPVNSTSWSPVDLAGGLEIVTLVAGVGTDASGLVSATDWCAVWLGAPDRLETSHTKDYAFRVDAMLPGAAASPSHSSRPFDLVDADGDAWADVRFLQHPTPPLRAPLPGTSLLPMNGSCNVPAPS